MNFVLFVRNFGSSEYALLYKRALEDLNYILWKCHFAVEIGIDFMRDAVLAWHKVDVVEI